jgi:V8-like Glu-specific endopeptidase
MNKQNQWLFEAPVTSEALYTNPYNNPEWEAERELTESSPLNEEEWETVGRLKVPRRSVPKRPGRVSRSCPPVQSTQPRIVDGWGQYKQRVQELPPSQQAILRKVGNEIRISYQPGCQPVRMVQIYGHADRDTPRNIQHEKQMSEERARMVTSWLKNYVGNNIAGRITWDTKGFGATKLKAPPTVEANRRQNRRVEIYLHRLTAQPTMSYPILIRHPSRGYIWSKERESISREFWSEAEQSSGCFSGNKFTPILNTLNQPFKWICHLQIDFGPETISSVVTGEHIIAKATGFLISPRHVLTAGHCLLTQSDKSTPTIFGNLPVPIKALEVTITPALNLTPTPLGSQTVTNPKYFRVSSGWENSKAIDQNFDFGLITLERPFGSNYGFWGSANYQIQPLTDKVLQAATLRSSGYPNICPSPDPNNPLRCSPTNMGTTQWQTCGSTIKVLPNVINYDLKGESGLSGSPVWTLNDKGILNLIAIHTGSATDAQGDRRRGTRITEALLRQLRQWLKEDNVLPSF